MSSFQLGATQYRPQYGDEAPEVAPGTAPEYVYHGPSDVGPKIVINASEPTYDDDLKAEPVRPPEPWCKRMKMIILLTIVFIVLVALAIGLGVGLSLSNRPISKDQPAPNSDPESDDQDAPTDQKDSNHTETSALPCHGEFCPRTLSVLLHDRILYAFARTNDSNIAMRTLNGTSWSDRFVDLGAPPGKLISQPWGGTWSVHNEFGRLDLFVVTAAQRTVYGKHFSNAEGWSDWNAEGPNVGSAVSICRVNLDQLHLWSTAMDTNEVYHTWWVHKDDRDINPEALENGITEEQGNFKNNGGPWDREKNNQQLSLGITGSAVAAMCRQANTYHEVFWYNDRRDGLLYSSYNYKVGWSESQQWDGKFIGDPTVVSRNQDQWEAFAVQNNHTLHYTTWSPGSGGFRPLRNLGGNILSAPAIEFLGDDIIDIIALGTDGELKHLHFDGRAWGTEWEGLGITAYSAPSTMQYEDRLYILMLNKEGNLIVLSRDASSNTEKWKGSLEQSNLGGNFTFDYLTHTSGV
ncbi:hypothetical protein HJFPF1_09474 [Paramyrothecium foliicola]|nr:hypothetical protein HJFPF1_09474 [Paramyrothecium foliicola]